MDVIELPDCYTPGHCTGCSSYTIAKHAEIYIGATGPFQTMPLLQIDMNFEF